MDTLRTAEVRWFVRGRIPAAVRAWFDGLGPEAVWAERTDRYLTPGSDGLGVKLREGAVEAKRRTGTGGRLASDGAEVEVERWAKWSFALADGGAAPRDGWVEVRKRRAQRHAEAGGGACALELSEVEVAGQTWWSVCLEASGPDAAARRAALDDGRRRWLAAEAAPVLPAEAAAGYPAWLRRIADEPDGV